MAKGIGEGVFELRLDFAPGYRDYFGKHGERLVILLGGGSKKRQQADIENHLAISKSFNDQAKRTRDFAALLREI